MKINLVTGAFLSIPPARCGAVEMVWARLAEEFHALGHDVRLHVKDDPKLADFRPPYELVKVPGAERSGSIKRDLLVGDWGYSRRVASAIRPADITLTSVFWLPAILQFRKRKIGRLAIEVQRVPKSQMRLYRYVDGFLAVSSMIADAVRAELPRSLDQRVWMSLNPIATDIFVPPKHLRCSGNTTNVLYTGRVHPEKGLSLLIDAAALVASKHPNLTLSIVGPTATKDGGGGEAYVKQLQARARNCRIEFIPAIYDRQAMCRTLQAADVYVYPSIAAAGEACPVAPMEAMATGLAPVVSDLRQFDDYLKTNQTGLRFDHRADNAPEQLAQAITRQIENPAEAQRMGSAAVELISRCSYRAIAKDRLAWFEQLCRKD